MSGDEGDESAAGADVGPLTVFELVPADPADELHLVGDPVIDEDIAAAIPISVRIVRVPRDDVCGRGIEGHVAPVAADDREETAGIAAGEVAADEGGRTGLAVPEIHVKCLVVEAVRILRNEGAVGHERDPSPVVADNADVRSIAAAGARSIASHAHQLDLICLPVVQVHALVNAARARSGNEVRRLGHEEHVAAASTDPCVRAPVVRPSRQVLGDPRGAIAHDDIASGIARAAAAVGGRRHHDEPGIRRHPLGDRSAEAPELLLVAVDAHELDRAGLEVLQEDVWSTAAGTGMRVRRRRGSRPRMRTRDSGRPSSQGLGGCGCRLRHRSASGCHGSPSRSPGCSTLRAFPTPDRPGRCRGRPISIPAHSRPRRALRRRRPGTAP